MNILQTVPSLDLVEGGGLGAAALALHQQLLADGARSELITTRRSGAIPQEWITTLPMARRNPFFYDPRSRVAIDEAVRRADIVHTHGLYNHLNWCVGDSCARWNKALVYHPHGTLAPWYLRKRWFAKQIVHRLFEDRNFKLVRLWRAVSDAEASDIHAACPGAKVVVIPNGIHVEDFAHRHESSSKPSYPGVDSKRRCLLFLGRIAAVKGLDLLLEAWAHLKRFHAEWQLVIVGPDFEGYLPKLRKAAASLKGNSAPAILGSAVGDAKRLVLRCADLFVLPSRAEGQPLTILEALASSLPVVISTNCNLPATKLGHAGWVCQPQTESLRSSLAAALSNSDAELRRRGQIARRMVESEYDWKSTSAALLEHSARCLITRATSVSHAAPSRLVTGVAASNRDAATA